MYIFAVLQVDGIVLLGVLLGVLLLDWLESLSFQLSEVGVVP